MIAKPFYLLKKIIFTTKFTNKSKEKILFTTNLKQPKLKTPFFITTPIQTTSFLLKLPLLV